MQRFVRAGELQSLLHVLKVGAPGSGQHEIGDGTWMHRVRGHPHEQVDELVHVVLVRAQSSAHKGTAAGTEVAHPVGGSAQQHVVHDSVNDLLGEALHFVVQGEVIQVQQTRQTVRQVHGRVNFVDTIEHLEAMGTQIDFQQFALELVVQLIENVVLRGFAGVLRIVVELKLAEQITGTEGHDEVVFRPKDNLIHARLVRVASRPEGERVKS
mmetsp:Transcript_19049/g.32916  ORF Transcript_19049/g.32916 Transcript_19049/m.32916 type:complete len:212 (+) Transcript_19049:1252-1887(+)